MDGLQLYQELDSKQRLLDGAVSELRERGTALAQAERDYKTAKAKAILAEREKGTPATITLDLVMGDDEVSLKRFKRDCAEVLYRSALEFIQVNKLELKILQNQISQEMGRAERL